jgi:hypothetical protein
MPVMPRQTIAILALSVLLVGCTNPTPSSVPSQAAVATPSPPEQAAITFRVTFGLRADLAYVRAVADDATASSNEFAVPLLPAEVKELQSRPSDPRGIIDAVQPYADLYPADFGAMFQDPDHVGVTFLWVRYLEAHAEAVWRRVRPGSRLTFRYAAYAFADLRALQDRVGGDWDWMRADAIAPTGVGVDEAANWVELDVSSANPNATALILAHYTVPADMLHVVSDGTGAALIPRGTVTGHVLDSRGKPPGQAIANQVDLGWLSDGPGDCGYGDIGYGINADGLFEVPCQAGGHTIVIQISVPDGGWKTIASGHVVAVAGKTVTMTIRLDKPWSEVISP